MANWTEIIETFFRLSDPENDFRHVTQPGVSKEAFAEIEATLKTTLPEELKDFYCFSNGMGLLAEDEPDEPRFIPPLERFPAFVAACRASFSETHPIFAERYLPCVNWDNGDATGYLLDKDGKYLPDLFTFLHELYKFDSAQDVNDFLQPSAEGLAVFLTPEEEN